jgi:EAL domain-containing protein (putative c-di-GMP-specific phosphodiesterase class I)
VTEWKKNSLIRRLATAEGQEDIESIYESYDAMKHQNEMMQAQLGVLHLIALGKPLSQILTEITNQYNSLFDEQLFCSIYLYDDVEESFVNGRSVELPYRSIKHQFLDHEVLSQYPFEKAVKFIEPVMITEIPANHTFTEEFNYLLKASGIRSCWLFPFFTSDHNLLGLHMFYSQATIVPPIEIQKTVEAIVNLNALAVEINRGKGSCQSTSSAPLTGIEHLEQALANREFTLVYQPIINMESRGIHSLEALIRWNHPVKGTIYPGAFIPLAEEYGFIVRLGEWVLREVCSQNKRWQDQGLPPVRVAVNVSVKQFQEQAFLQRVQKILNETQLSPNWLEIEITESTLMKSEKNIMSLLQTLKQMGIFLSIDDFGTGFSSLDYLKSFDVHALKVDRSFIYSISEKDDKFLITQMIIVLAHKLHLEVIGEGVETEVQHQILKDFGCEYAQGFYYYRPLAPDQVPIEIAHHHDRKRNIDG